MDRIHLNQKHMKMQIVCKSLFTNGVQNVYHLHGHMLGGDAFFTDQVQCQLEMWANAQRDGRPAEYTWRHLFKVWLTPTTRMPCINAAKTRNPLKLAGVPQTRQQISAAIGPKFTVL